MKIFEWFKSKPSKPKDTLSSYVNPFSVGDRVELVWRLYNEGGQYSRLSQEDSEAEIKNVETEMNFDIFQIFIDQGKIGTVVWTRKYCTTVSLDGFPFDITVSNGALKKLEQ